jgi:hypothetical protein
MAFADLNYNFMLTRLPVKVSNYRVYTADGHKLDFQVNELPQFVLNLPLLNNYSYAY